MKDVVEMMDQEIKDLLAKSGEMDPRTEDYAKIMKQVVELTKVRNDALKIDSDSTEAELKRVAETCARCDQLEEEKRQFKIKTLMDGTKIALSILVVVGLSIADSKGIFMNRLTSDLFRGMKFGIKS